MSRCGFVESASRPEVAKGLTAVATDSVPVDVAHAPWRPVGKITVLPCQGFAIASRVI